MPDAFNFPISLTLSTDGESLVAGTANGEVRVWRLKDGAGAGGVRAYGRGLGGSTQRRPALPRQRERGWDGATVGRPSRALAGYTAKRQAKSVALP